MELEPFWKFVRAARRDAAQRDTALAALRYVRGSLRELQAQMDAVPPPELPDGSLDAVALLVDAEEVPAERPQVLAGVWLQRLRDERLPEAAESFTQAGGSARTSSAHGLAEHTAARARELPSPARPASDAQLPWPASGRVHRN